ncbi:MAG: hypothetical protein K6E53_12140 [Lachnospiraceae bacterium]|nr:hypothetical protein [Lachnospiraceae bacterium]
MDNTGSGRNKTLTVLSAALFAGSLLLVVFFIFTRERVSYNLDYTDSLIWAAASVEGHAFINHDFWYAYIIPFSGSLLMIPVVKIFGVTYLAHEIGMTLFAFVFAAAVLFGFKSLGMTMQRSSLSTGIILLLLCSSSTTRMIFFGHVIHYSLAMVFTCIAYVLLNKLDCLYKEKYDLKHKMIYILLLIWTYLCCINGSSAVMLFFCPVAGAIILERMLDRSEITFDNIKVPAVRLIGMFAAAGAGFLTKRYRIQPYFDNSYEESFSALLSHEDWFFKEQSFMVRFSTLLTDWVYEGTPMLSFDGMLILLRLVLSVILIIVPFIALFFYKKCNNRMMRISLLAYWVLFVLTQLTYSVAKIQEANWRLAALMGMSMIVSVTYLLWALKEPFYNRFAYLILAVFVAASCAGILSVLQLPTDSSENGYERLAAVLDENGLNYGYTELWGGANAVTVMTDSKIKVRAIRFDGDGDYSIERYQGQASWYDDQPGVDRYFIVVPDVWMEDCRDTLVSHSTGQIPFEDSTILVFDHNLFKDGKAVHTSY